MTQVSRKGFRDKNGRKVVIIPPKEEYTGEAIFSDSDAIDTILSEGVHHISYKKDGKRHPTQHILVVTRNYGKTGPIAPTREIVFQLLIDNLGGMMKRYRKFTDTELLGPDGDWTEWVSMIPTVDSTITEDGDNPVTGAAIYAALAGKAASTHSHAIADVTGLINVLNSKMDKEMELSTDDYLVICKKYVEDASVPAYPTSETYSQTIYYLNEFVANHAAEIEGVIEKYIPCRVELKTASAAAGKVVFAIVEVNNVLSSDDLHITVYVGSSVFELDGEAGAQGYTWSSEGGTVEGWAKTDLSTF